MIETYTVFIRGNTRAECREQARSQLEHFLRFDPFNIEEARLRGIEVDLQLSVDAVVTVGGDVVGWRGQATATIRERWVRK